MNLIKSLVCICIVFFLCICGKIPLHMYTSSLIKFDIPKVIEQKVKPTPLSRFARSCSYIPLETTKASVLKMIKQVYTTDREIIVVDVDKCLTFDKFSGKFIRKIGTTGKGPNEYLWIVGSAFDEKNKIIYILSGWNYAIIGYNTEGRVIHYVPRRHAKRMQYIDLIDSVTYAGIISNSKGNEKGRLLIGSLQENSVQTVVPNRHSFFTLKQANPNVFIGSHYNTGVQLYHFNQQLFMKECWNDTVFEIKKNAVIIPKYMFYLGNLKIPEEFRGQADRIDQLLSSHCIDQVIPLETNNYLFFEFNQKQLNYACIYDKQKKELTLVDKQSWNFLPGMKNDLYGGIPFWPKYINQKGEMIKWLNADHFLFWQKMYGTEILPNLGEEDNPVVMIAH